MSSGVEEALDGVDGVDGKVVSMHSRACRLPLQALPIGLLDMYRVWWMIRVQASPAELILINNRKPLLWS